MHIPIGCYKTLFGENKTAFHSHETAFYFNEVRYYRHYAYFGENGAGKPLSKTKIYTFAN
jgi:hypothetical protein